MSDMTPPQLNENFGFLASEGANAFLEELSKTMMIKNDEEVEKYLHASLSWNDFFNPPQGIEECNFPPIIPNDEKEVENQLHALQSLNSLLNAPHSMGEEHYPPAQIHRILFKKMQPILEKIHDLLNDGVNLDDVLKSCPDLLHAAVAAGNATLVEYLLQQNMKVDRKMDKDATLLHCAAFFGRLEVMATLIHHGANINATMSKKLTPLHLASLQGHVIFAIALINFGADINAQDDWGRTALHNALFFRNAAIVWALLLRGADADIKDMNNEVAYKLLAQSVSIDYKTIYSETCKIVSKAFFGFSLCLYHFGYKLKKNFNDNSETLSDHRDTVSVYSKGLHLKKNKEKILKMNRAELITISGAKIDDSVFAQEVILMRDTVIYNNVTLYDLLTEDCSKIARYLVGTEIPDLTAFSRNGFYYVLQKRINAVQRHNLFGWAAHELGQRLQIRLPQEVMDEVVKYLDEQNVRNILRATIGYRGEDEKIQEAEQEFETTFEIDTSYYVQIEFDDDYEF